MWRQIVFLAAGGIAGYLYYRLVGCSTGSCPLTANPYVSILFGALFGLILAMN